VTVAEYPDDPDQWRAGAERHAGSWWDDWADWGAKRAGELVEPPPMGSEKHPVLGEAPGEYVRT
jgi:polyhydroxyalkanoate synthase